MSMQSVCSTNSMANTTQHFTNEILVYTLLLENLVNSGQKNDSIICGIY